VSPVTSRAFVLVGHSAAALCRNRVRDGAFVGKHGEGFALCGWFDPAFEVNAARG
jgi:hypothetical protein